MVVMTVVDEGERQTDRAGSTSPRKLLEVFHELHHGLGQFVGRLAQRPKELMQRSMRANRSRAPRPFRMEKLKNHQREPETARSVV